MALDETLPIDGDGVTTGVQVDELAAAIRTLRTSLNTSELDRIGTTTVQSAIGPVDDVNVANVTTIFIDCSSNSVTIGGFTGGVNGQVLHVVKLCATTHTATIEHIEGGGSQDIYLHAGADEALTSEYGGWKFVCNGTNWYDASHSKHV